MKINFINKIRSLLINLLRKKLCQIYTLLFDKDKIIKKLKNSNKAYSKYLELSGNFTADPADLISIYRTIIKLKPKNILELGPGVSTYAICLAILKLKEKDKKYKPNFIAVEESKKWFKEQLRNLPKDFENLLNIRYSKIIIKNKNGFPFAHFKDIPKLKYDFIHLDGPNPPYYKSGNKVISTYTVDIINIWKNINQKCYIIIDGREKTALHLIKQLPNLNFKRHIFTFSYHLYI